MMAIAIKNSDGSLVIMRLAESAAEAAKLSPEHLDIVVQAEVDAWPEEHRAKVVSFRSVSDEAIPQDLTFSYAWRDNGGISIEFDMAVCRELWRDKMRVARIPKLQELDVQFQRALETGAPTTEIVAAKQALRDCPATPAIDGAQTPEQLKLVWPAELD